MRMGYLVCYDISQEKGVRTEVRSQKLGGRRRVGVYKQGHDVEGPEGHRADPALPGLWERSPQASLGG